MPIKIKECPSQERLAELFEYRDGKLFWREARRHGQIKAGSEAGTLTPFGYMRVNINRRIYAAHRLIWTLLRGLIPEGAEIDHINGVRDDNRIENLRLATASENKCNRKRAHRNNVSTGVLGVYKELRCNSFRAHCQHNGKTVAKNFKNVDEATQWRNATAKQLHGDFAGLAQ